MRAAVAEQKASALATELRERSADPEAYRDAANRLAHSDRLLLEHHVQTDHEGLGLGAACLLCELLVAQIGDLCGLASEDDRSCAALAERKALRAACGTVSGSHHVGDTECSYCEGWFWKQQGRAARSARLGQFVLFCGSSCAARGAC